jgi:uncharacterized protein (TIGR02118 family)
MGDASAQGGHGVIKALRAFRRVPEMDTDEFLRRWDQHAELVLAVPGVRGYVQSPKVGREDQSTAPFDGFSSMWFDDVEAAARAATSPAARAAREDSARFIAAEGVVAINAIEHIARDVAMGPEAVKLTFFFWRRIGLSPEVFREHWRDVHGPLVMQYIDTLRRFIQNYAVESAYTNGAEPDVDGIAEAYLDNLAVLDETEVSPEHDLVRSDEPNFIDVNRVCHLVAADRVYLTPPH